MIEVAVQREEGWNSAIDWDDLALRAATSALQSSAYGWIIERRFLAEISVRLTDNDEVRTLNRSAALTLRYAPSARFQKRMMSAFPLPDEVK